VFGIYADDDAGPDTLPRRARRCGLGATHFAVLVGTMVLLAAGCGGGEQAGESIEVIDGANGTSQPVADSGDGASEDAQVEVPDEGAADSLDGPLVVGSKDFTEAYILGHMYALMLEEAGFNVERKLGIGATPIAHQALVDGEIHVYPEYTSTALLTVLKESAMSDREAIYTTVKQAYSQQFDLVWLSPSPFNNPQALATRRDVAEEHDIATYSDLAAAAPELSIGGPPEFFEREDGLPGLREAYGGFEFSATRSLDPGLRYPALLAGDIDVVLAFGTDGQINGYDLVLLEDDKGFFTPYPVAPVVRADVLDVAPAVGAALDTLAPRLTNEVMQRLNWEVDGPENREPEEVAREFLVAEGLVK